MANMSLNPTATAAGELLPSPTRFGDIDRRDSRWLSKRDRIQALREPD
jgi:hypothetical protein